MVYLIRHPILAFVSGYLYDMSPASNIDLHGFNLSDVKRMRRLPVSEGILLEAEHAFNSYLKQMANAYLAVRHDPDILVLRLEDFIADSKKFDDSAARAFQHLFALSEVPQLLISKLCEDARAQDLNRHLHIDPNHTHTGQVEVLHALMSHRNKSLQQQLQRFVNLMDYGDFNALSFQAALQRNVSNKTFKASRFAKKHLLGISGKYQRGRWKLKSNGARSGSLQSTSGSSLIQVASILVAACQVWA
jgi:hypothetical protein